MPIIKRLTDVDMYKFTMEQIIWKNWSGVKTKFGFRNRTKGVRLLDYVDIGRLREELDHAQSLRFTQPEIDYLSTIKKADDRKMFSPGYLDFLKGFQLPEYNLEKGSDGNPVLEFEADWPYASHWETIALSIVNELYSESLLNGLSKFERERVWAEMITKLADKIKILKQYADIIFSDFGTRRRFMMEAQRYVVMTMAEELKEQFLGTSNVMMAMEFGLVPMGTSAHELPMILAAMLDDGTDEDWVNTAQQLVLDSWWKEYGYGLSIALSDTFGTSWFFRNMTDEQARNWKGTRHDSGYPLVYANKAIKFYERRGIDPKEKLIVFSDGLDIQTIIAIANYCRGRIKHSYGWGTNLTNDLGFRTLSLVVKALMANGHSTVKLSDNLAKALGSPEDIERYMRACRYRRKTKQYLRS